MERLKDPDRKKLFIFDGTAIVFRSYFALPQHFTRKEGLPNNALRGILFSFSRFIANLSPTFALCVFDAGRVTFRNEIFPAYKANRDEPPFDLQQQFEWCPKICDALGIPVDERSGFEADDLIASYVIAYKDYFDDIYIISQDKDLYQLVDSKVHLWNWPKDYPGYLEKLEEKYGFSPDRMASFLALKGDSVDNIPGLPGIGDKSARILVSTFGKLDGIYENIERLPTVKIRGAKRIQNSLQQHRELAYLYYQLTELKDDIPGLLNMDKLLCRGQNIKKLTAIAEKFEINISIETLTRERFNNDLLQK
ncbi:5'-3' exonuclease H3TH domain-containing protein [Candidatus Riflebacteria bacterium]